MAEFVWYQNGDWIPRSEVTLDPDDRGPRLGDQVVDVERTFGGKGFKPQMNWLSESLSEWVAVRPQKPPKFPPETRN